MAFASARVVREACARRAMRIVAPRYFELRQ
jgi:hypothetical protein